MELVKRLGMRLCSTGKTRANWGLFACPKCGVLVEKQIANGKRDKSCGCTHFDVHFKHGRARRYRKGSSLYNVWNAMLGRCYIQATNGYGRYGGRGIYVCHEWRYNFLEFEQWALENGWEPGLQLHRIDNDGPYAPENCKCVTPSQNRRAAINTKLTWEGVLLMRGLYSTGKFTYANLAQMFAISASHAGNVVRGKLWREAE